MTDNYANLKLDIQETKRRKVPVYNIDLKDKINICKKYMNYENMKNIDKIETKKYDLIEKLNNMEKSFEKYKNIISFMEKEIHLYKNELANIDDILFISKNITK